MTQASQDGAIGAAPSGSRLAGGGVWIEESHRRVRAYLSGRIIADSSRCLLAFENTRVGVYWFPLADVRMEMLSPEDRRAAAPTTLWTATVGARAVAKAARCYVEPTGERAPLKGHIALYWDRMDEWFEEDDEVFQEPRNPYHRVDALHSSRHVRVAFAGQVIAESDRPVMVFETGLPPRYYIPKQDVRMDLLEPSDTTTRCPYKGLASYWSLRSGETDGVEKDLAWAYALPIPECPKIENLLSFWGNRVEIEVEGS